VTYVPVETDGFVTAENVIAALTNDTILVTLMLANNGRSSQVETSLRGAILSLMRAAL